MTTEQWALFHELAALDVRLAVRDGKLSADAPRGVMTPDLAARVKRHKLALVSYLSRTCATCRHLDQETARRDGWPEEMGVCVLG